MPLSQNVKNMMLEIQIFKEVPERHPNLVTPALSFTFGEDLIFELH